MKLSHQLQELLEEFLVGCFTGGLRDAVKYEIIAKNPSTIENAIRLVRIEEEKISNQRRGFKSPLQKQVYSSGTLGGGGGGSPLKSPSSTAAPHPPAPIKRLTIQELREKREKELCFHYDKKYVAGHRCQHQKLFRLEIFPKEGEEEPE